MTLRGEVIVTSYTRKMTHAFNVKEAEEYGVEAAIVLNSIRWWLEKNLAEERNIKDGYVWTYNTVKELLIYFPYWSEKKVQRLMKKMADDGAIISRSLNENPYDQTRWYTLSEFCLKKDENQPKNDVSDCNSRKDKSEQSISQNCPMQSSKVSNLGRTKMSILGRTDLSFDLYQDLTQLKKYIKKDFDKDYLERAYLTFWQAGLNQTNTVQAEKLFHQLWQDLDKEPMEFAQFLREDIEKRLSLNQYGFERLHPATYLKNKRWLDEYIVFRKGRKVSLTPLQLQIDSTQERLCQLQARRKSEQQSLELHERGGTASLVALDSFRNSIKNIDNQIVGIEQQLSRLRTDSGGGS